MRKLYLEATSRCNFDCVMCFRRTWFDETPRDMSDEVFSAVLSSLPALPDLQTVFIGGQGEPLLHPRVFEMIAACRQYAEVELITNGALLTPACSRALRGAGLTRLWVSVDAFSDADDGIRHGSRFSSLCERLSYFSGMPGRPALGFTFVAMPENFSELKGIDAFADRFGADLIHISRAVPSAPISREAAGFDTPLPVGRMRRLSEPPPARPKDVCPFIEADAVFVRPDGEVCPCMPLMHNADTFLFEERRRVRRACFGKVTKEGLSAIRESKEYRDFRTRVRDFDFPCCTVCLGCEDRLGNERDCMYNPFPTCGGCLWSQGYISCP